MDNLKKEPESQECFLNHWLAVAHIETTLGLHQIQQNAAQGLKGPHYDMLKKCLQFLRSSGYNPPGHLLLPGGFFLTGQYQGLIFNYIQNLSNRLKHDLLPGEIVTLGIDDSKKPISKNLSKKCKIIKKSFRNREWVASFSSQGIIAATHNRCSNWAAQHNYSNCSLHPTFCRASNGYFLFCCWDSKDFNSHRFRVPQRLNVKKILCASHFFSKPPAQFSAFVYYGKSLVCVSNNLGRCIIYWSRFEASSWRDKPTAVKWNRSWGEKWASWTQRQMPHTKARIDFCHTSMYSKIRLDIY